MFSKDLPGLPLDREIEFTIDLLPEDHLNTISILPYRMALVELQELKIQLQDLLNRDFIRLSVSP